jgi:hypothetical protein
MPLKVNGFELAKLGAARLPEYLGAFGYGMPVTGMVYLFSPSTRNIAL